jgi:hypothetical protein
MQGIISFILANKGIMVLLGSHVAMFGLAAIKTMPKPGTTINKAAMYTWLFDWLHQSFNL